MIGERARGDLLHDPAVPGKGWEGCHDLTGGRALVCIAGELREREAARAARAARRRASWLFRLVRRIRDWRARWDRSAAGRPAASRSAWEARGRSCPGCGCRLQDWPNLLCPACEEVDREMARQVVEERVSALGADELLALTRAACLRDHRPELAAAVQAVRLLDLTGNLDDMAPLVAAVRGAFETPGDSPRGDIN